MRQIALIVLLLTLSTPAVSLPSDEIAPCPDASLSRLSIDPDLVAITLFYKGSTVRLEGEVPNGYGLAIRLAGAGQTIELKRKGKVLGFLWMNVADVTIEDIPAVYMVATSCSLAALAPPGEVAALGIGYESISPVEGDAHEAFQELLKLKDREELYSLNIGAVNLETTGPGTAEFSTSFRLPPRIPPGSYRVDVIGFRGGGGCMLGSCEVEVERRGFIRFLSLMAYEHGLLYGSMAVSVAILAGLLAGVVFGLGSSRGH